MADFNDIAKNLGQTPTEVKRYDGQSEWSYVREFQANPKTVDQLPKSTQGFIADLKDMDGTPREKLALIHDDARGRIRFRVEPKETDPTLNYERALKGGDCDNYATIMAVHAQAAGLAPENITWAGGDVTYKSGTNSVTVGHAYVAYRDPQSGEILVADKNLQDLMVIDPKTGRGSGRLADNFDHKEFAKPGAPVEFGIKNIHYSISPGDNSPAWRYSEPVKSAGDNPPAPEKAPAAAPDNPAPPVPTGPAV